MGVPCAMGIAMHVTLPRLLTVWFDYSKKLHKMDEHEGHRKQTERELSSPL